MVVVSTLVSSLHHDLVFLKHHVDQNDENNGVNVDDKTKLVREGLDAIWKEVQGDTQAEGWTQVTRRRSGTNPNNAPDENIHLEEHNIPSTSNATRTPNHEAAKWNPHKGRHGWKKK